MLIFQFTTSQGGRLISSAFLFDSISLSIHDLTRRSTSLGRRRAVGMDLSIHDLTRRSTEKLINGPKKEDLSIHDLTRRSTLA